MHDNVGDEDFAAKTNVINNFAVMHGRTLLSIRQARCVS